MNDSNENYNVYKNLDVKEQNAGTIYNVNGEVTVNNYGVQENHNLNKKIKFKIPIKRNSDFTGRIDELKDIDSKIKEFSNVILTGQSGTGKTSLVVEYINRYIDTDTSVYWIDATNGISLENSIGRILERIGFAEKKRSIEQFFMYLEEEENWILVFDSINDLKIYSIMDGYDLSGKIISSTIIAHTDYPEYEVEINELKEEDANQYIKNKLNCKGDDANRLLSRLGLMPIALNLSTTYINTCKITVEDYLKRYEQKTIDLFKAIEGVRGINKVISPVKKPILYTWEIIVTGKYFWRNFGK